MLKNFYRVMQADGGGEGGAGGEGGGAPASWFGTFNDDNKGYVQNKGFKDAETLLTSYRNMEKLIGAPQERVLKLPEKADDPEWGGVYDRLGRPKDAKEYKLGEMATGKLGEWARSTFHELGLTASQAEKFATKWNEFSGASSTEAETALNHKSQQEETELKSQWGGAHDQNIEIARRGASEFGMTNDQVDQLQKVMGYKGTMTFLHSIGAKVGESNFDGGSGGGNKNMRLTPEAAKSEINRLGADPEFAKKFLSKDAEAMERMSTLHKMAAGNA